jgi:hypothetical protein
MSFDFRGLRYFPSADDVTACYFLPRQPGLQSDADGRPMLTMVDLGASAYLLFTGRWAASEIDLNDLRSELAARDCELVDLVKLSYAPITSPRCNVLIGDGGGSFQTIATSNTSGFPPYDAAFNLFLENDRLAHAKAGLRGEQGFLGIEYQAELPVPIKATATLRARAHHLLPWLRAHSASSNDPSRLLEDAVEAQVAEIVLDMVDLPGTELTVELYNKVIAEAAQMLSRWIEQDAPGDIHVAVTVEQNIHEPVRAFADIGAIVSTDLPQATRGGENAAN